MSAPNWQRFLETASLDARDIRQLLAGRAICAHQHRIDLALAPGIQGSPFSDWIKREATDGPGVARRVLVAVVDPWDRDPIKEITI